MSRRQRMLVHKRPNYLGGNRLLVKLQQSQSARTTFQRSQEAKQQT